MERDVRKSGRNPSDPLVWDVEKLASATECTGLVPAAIQTPEEAEEFLEDCMAVVVKNLKEVRAYFEDEADISGMSNEELLEASEVFALPSGRFLIVEA
jgi:hypothetical protein